MKKNNELNLFEVSLHVFMFISRSKYILLGFILAGILIGVLHAKLQPPYYSANMTASSSIISNERSASLLRRIQRFAKYRNYEVLQEKMNISYEAAQSIISVEAEPINEKGVNLASVNNQANWFKINVEVTNAEYLNQISTGIIFLFSSNPYISKRMEAREIQLNKLIDGYNRKLVELDSLEKAIYAAATGKGDIVIVNTEHAYQVDIMLLMQERSKIEEEFMLLEPLSVISDFSPILLSKSAFFLSILYGGISFIIGTMISFLLLLYRKVKNHIAEFEN